MDRHYISDSMLFDIWCWRECTPAILKRVIQQLASIGVNYTTIEADCWYGERTPGQNYELQYVPFEPSPDGTSWDLSKPNTEWDARLREFITLCNANNITVQLQLFTQQYDHWRDFMPWSHNVNGVYGLWPCTDYHRQYVHRAVDACRDLDVRYSVGCELMGNPDDVARFHVDVLEIPYARGAELTSFLLGTDQGDTFVAPPNSSLESEQIKARFDKQWVDLYGANGQDSTAYFIRRYAHGVNRLNVSGALDIGIRYHAPYATQWEYSTDGDWTGDSEVDYIEHQGRVDRKPNWAQMFALSGKLFDSFSRPIVIDSFHEGQYDGATGRPIMAKLIDAMPLLDNTMGVVNAYETRYGKLENHGKPVDPYPEPEPEPEPEPQPEPPKPPKPGMTWQGWLGLAMLALGILAVAVFIL